MAPPPGRSELLVAIAFASARSLLAGDGGRVLRVPGISGVRRQVLISALFVLSLDLILGFAGIISLGHALYFGFAAYVVGLCSLYGWSSRSRRRCSVA
jgi:ABC-type branched-subunit amino acid transport system permease subunit